MGIEPKKNIRLKNRTYFFDPDKDRTHVRFGSPLSYQYRQSKIEGYESRLYWQFRYCQDHDGQVFYYTLTYNDKALPKKYGQVCFDYEHLRDLLTGGFRKRLLRDYGCTFKYFIGAELGDGKGTRGFHNNPHYHILFFLENANKPEFPYLRIDSKCFRHLVRLYWQGFDQDEGFHSFKTAKYGIAQEGENLGLVTDFRACVYCAKYVCKDVKLKMKEDDVQSILRMKYVNEFKDSDKFALEFLHDKVYPLYNYKYDESCDVSSDFIVVQGLLPDSYFDEFRSIFGQIPIEAFKPAKDLVAVCSCNGLWKLYFEYFDKAVDDAVRLGLNEWRNRFCNKCRISHGVGDYALKFVNDKLCPLIRVPSKTGFKYRTPCLYYYRKLYTNLTTPISFIQFGKRKGEVKRFNQVRILNDLGIDYKISTLSKRADALSSKVFNLCEKVLSDPALFLKLRRSSVNTDVFAPFEYYSKFSSEFLKIASSYYAYYKLVYEDRFFKFDSMGFDGSCEFPKLDYLADYRRFLRSSVGYVSCNNLLLDSFLEGGCQGYLPYSQHEHFSRYWCVFPLFDLCSDYFFVKDDDKKQKIAEDIAAVKRYHVNRGVSHFLNQL